MQISVAIITYNEEQHIARCLASIEDLADEVVVLDSGSTDQTRAICEMAGAQVYVEKFAGHIEQKNKALALARHPWVLSLDADEALSPELRTTIENIKNGSNLADGYTFNRLNQYCGQWVRHGGWYPDRKLRLWRRDLGQWGGLNPHDKVVMQPTARVQHLDGDLLHYAYRSIEEHRQKTEHYALISAKAKFAAGKRALPGFAWLAAIWCFFQMYILRFGIFDGRNGLWIALISSREKLLKYQYLSKML